MTPMTHLTALASTPLRLAASALLALVAQTATAAEAPPLQAMATCRDSWLDWKDDAARSARFADYVQAGFVAGERGDAFTPRVGTTVLGFPVVRLFPQSVGMGLGFSAEVKAGFEPARRGLEKQIGRTMSCSTSEGVRSCEAALADKKTVVLMTGDDGKAATTLIGCYYYYQQ